MSWLARLVRCYGVHRSNPTVNSFKPNRSFSTFDSSRRTLESLRESSRIDLKKIFAENVMQSICWRMKNGIDGGSLALHEIDMINGNARLPQADDYDPSVHKKYVEAYKEFFVELFGSCNEPLHDWQYLDIKKYVKYHMTTEGHMSFLRLHPYFSDAATARRFVPWALQRLRNLNNKLLPYPIQANRDSYDTWQEIYRKVVCSRKVHIEKSIQRLDDGIYRHVIMSMYEDYKAKGKSRDRSPINNDDPIDELIFFENVCTHIRKHMEIPVGEDFYPILCQALREVPTEMFGLFWMYREPPSQDFPSKVINLEFVRTLR